MSEEKSDEEVKEYTFYLTDLEAGYLNAAVVDFFHKMRVAAEEKSVVLFTDDRYNVAKNLWKKVEDQTKIGDWK